MRCGTKAGWTRDAIRAWRIVLVAMFLAASASPAAPAGPLRHEAYVWQRAWTPAVEDALTDPPPALSGWAVLAAEVAWTRAPHFVAYDARALAASGRPVGLAIRVPLGPPGFLEAADTRQVLAGVMARTLARARASGVAVGELQLDLDCPSKKLDAYASLLRALRPAAEGTPLTVTALADWTRHAGLARVAAAVDGIVLQVHGLSRTAGGDVGPLFSPSDARRAIARAGALGVPFRVALPTYAYELDRDDDGRIVALRAEEGERRDPLEGGDAVTTETRVAPPAELLGLLRDLARARPDTLQGVLWFRLPTRADRNNAPAPALAALIDGREPRAALTARAVQREPGLWDIELANTGSDRPRAPGRVTVAWTGAGLVAADTLSSAKETSRAGSTLVLDGPRDGVHPGAVEVVAWVRIDGPAEVTARVDLPRFPRSQRSRR